ncbi:MAG: LysR family transcriptional regulator [Sphingobium sp.]
MIDIRVLLDFAAVGDTLSFSAAARQTKVAQPRLSAQVKKLENLVGTPLFERTTRRVVFTPAGQRLYDMVRPTAQAVETLLTDVAALRTGCKGRLGLGTVILAEPDRRLADIISAFGKSHPEVDISIEAGSPEVHLARLAQRSLDLAFCPEVEPVDDHDSLPLHPVAFAVMMAADDPLAQMPALRPEDFAGRSVAIMQRTRNPAFFDRFFAPFVTAGAQPVYVPELRRALLRDKPGLIVTTIVPGNPDAQLRHGIVRRRVEGLPTMRMTLVRPRGTIPSPTAAAFWELCRRHYHDG